MKRPAAERGGRPIESVLVANRGEIAFRIARTCRRLGVRVLGVYAPGDEAHLSVMAAAARVPGYLDMGAIIDAAHRLGAGAIHPGYGFLAENPEFAAAVIEAGLTWVGPPPSAIAAMGSKAGARRLVAEWGVPVVPGYDGEDQSDATLVAEAERIGFPVLIKASAGGGGKGMRVVRTAGEVRPALAEARRIARSAFGDDRLVLERYLERPRHVEVQVLADGHGTVLHLFERECSIQRRHQKVVEEAPTPAFPPGEAGEAAREALWRDAVRAARAVGYEGAGTVEFMLAEGRHHFLEMNTRLQVEHPVTEAVTGLDLVELQLRVAGGRPLGLSQDDVRCSGHAIEVRLYAEDPDRDYLPQTGTVLSWVAPPEVRVDTGVVEGSRVGTTFDPMLAKVVAHGPDRETARRKLIRGLQELIVLGVRTNRDWLLRVLCHPAFGAGKLHTGFLDQHAAELAASRDEAGERLARIAAVVTGRLACGRRLPGIPQGWRLNRWRDARDRVDLGAGPVEVSWRDLGERHFEVDGVEVRVLHDRPLVLEVDGVVRTFHVAWASSPVPSDTEPAVIWVAQEDRVDRVRVLPEFTDPSARVPEGGCTAPMPGRIVLVCVVEGETVRAGDPLVVMEAMKMEQTVRAPEDGTVARVLVAEGDQVEAGSMLVELR